MARENLPSLFADFARYAGDVAVVQRRGYRREAWTYGKLAWVAYGVARELRERGVRTGDRVVLWSSNSAEWMASFWACMLLGAVAVPLDDGAAPGFAGRVIGETSARILVASREKETEMAAALQGRNSPGSGMSWLAVEDLVDAAAKHGAKVSERVSGLAEKPAFENIAAEPITRKHVAQILFTSGTTGEPRGVVLTHGNFLANLEPLERGIAAYRKYERWLHPLRFVTLVPLSHVFGQFMGLLVPPLLGATIVFEQSAKPADIVRSIRRERATALIGVPRMLDALRSDLQRDAESGKHGKKFRRAYQAAEGEKFLRRAWRFRGLHRRLGWKFWAFISGGAALSGETEEFFKRLGYAVVQGYGMTESASLISLNHPFRAAQGSVGKILPGREFKLAEDGEILVRGENISAGYWQAGSVRPSGADNWLHTGGIGELDSEGNLRFRGRKKNVIVTPAGLNVYPEDLEAVLRGRAGVRDVVVVPIEHGGNAEACSVFLMERGGNSGELAARNAVEAANRELAEYQRLRAWVLWPEADFPRTATGKPRLGAIAARATQILQGDVRESVAASGAGNLGQIIGRFGAGKSGEEGSGLEADLNLSSLDRVELMSALEQRYQVEISETAFAEAKTVGDVERLLRESSGPAVGVRSQRERRFEYAYPRWTQSAVVRGVRLAVYYGLVWPATQILGHPKIAGRENLREIQGPVLIVSNHITRRADIGLILAALPGRLRHRLAIAMGGETLREMRRPPGDWWFAKRWAYQLGYWLVTALFNVFPLPQFSGFRESFRFAGESLDRGYSVLIFPEGEVNNSATGEMVKFQTGIGLLWQSVRVPVVPMHLDGVWEMKREGRRLAKLGELTVRIGKPMNFSPEMLPEDIAKQLELAVRRMKSGAAAGET